MYPYIAKTINNVVADILIKVKQTVHKITFRYRIIFLFSFIIINSTNEVLDGSHCGVFSWLSSVAAIGIAYGGGLVDESFDIFLSTTDCCVALKLTNIAKIAINQT